MADQRTRAPLPTRSTSPAPSDGDDGSGPRAAEAADEAAEEAAENAAVEAALESADTATAEAVEDPEYSSQSETAALAAQAIGVRAEAEAGPGERRVRRAGM